MRRLGHAGILLPSIADFAANLARQCRGMGIYVAQSRRQVSDLRLSAAMLLHSNFTCAVVVIDRLFGYCTDSSHMQWTKQQKHRSLHQECVSLYLSLANYAFTEGQSRRQASMV